MYAVLKNRDLRLYLVGRFVAALGQQMMAMAIGWELYHRTHSALALGIVGLTQIVPMIALTLPAGHIADNYNRKEDHRADDVLRDVHQPCVGDGLGVAGSRLVDLLLPFCDWHLPNLPVGRERFVPSHARGTRRFVIRSQLECQHVSTFFDLGPAIGGGLVALAHNHGWAAPASPVYAVNALSALVCCILIGLVRRHHVVAIKEKMSLQGLLTGFNFVFANRIILGIITLDMFAVL